MRRIPFAHLVRHADKTRYVALVHDLPVEHLRHEAVTEHEEEHDGADAYPDVFQQFLLIHGGLFFW